jgi:hypothetical protein
VSRRAQTATETVELARLSVEEQRGILAQWEAELASAISELNAYRDQSGTAVLDDPASASRVAKQMQELRDRQEIAQRAVEAQRPRVVVAEAAYVAAEADVLEVALGKAREALTQHEAKTAELLKALEDHEGPFVPEIELIHAKRSGTTIMYTDAPTSWTLPKSAALHDQVRRLERQVAVLRELAGGRSPELLLQRWQSENVMVNLDRAEVCPPCVFGADALVPVDVHLRHVEEARAGDRISA